MTSWLPLCPPPPRSRFFVSYRSFEAKAAEAVAAALTDAGQFAWRDRSHLFTGDDWEQQIGRAIADCDDVVVLCTEQAARSQQVLAEVRAAVALGKRVHCFAAAELSTVPALYELIKHLNVEALPRAVIASMQADPAAFARAVVQRIFADATTPHPVDSAVFERLASRRLYPTYGVLAAPEHQRHRLVALYGNYADQIVRKRARRTAANALSAGVLALHDQRFSHAARCLTASMDAGGGALARYFHVFSLLAGARPRHLGGVARDLCVKSALSAWDNRRSPLIALLLGMVLWDSGVARNADVSRMFIEALQQLGDMPHEHDEVRRFCALLPRVPDLELPIERQTFMNYLSSLVENR